MKNELTAQECKIEVEQVLELENIHYFTLKQAMRIQIVLTDNLRISTKTMAVINYFATEIKIENKELIIIF